MSRSKLSHVVIGLAIFAAAAAQAADREVLYQVSTLDALLAGVYDRATTVAELKRNGDTGLGCFEALDGEMVVLDGVFYQVRADGSVCRAGDRMGSPFAAVTFFDRDSEIRLSQPQDLESLTKLLNARISSPGMFQMIRLEGDFDYVKTRSVPRQRKPYPKLAEVAAQQPTFEFHNTRGTIVGLFCPYFVAGSNMPGWHFHFLNDSRSGGGHLLNCRIKSGTVQLDSTPRHLLSLPGHEAYKGLNLQQANRAEAEQVEQDK